MIYLDSGIIIRLLEGKPAIRAPIENRVAAIPVADRVLITSRISRLECRCKPLREGLADVLALYDSFFRADEVRVEDIDAAMIEEATKLRASTGLKSPDAIHAATARLLHARSFWTTDTGFLRCPDLSVELFPAV